MTKIPSSKTVKDEWAMTEKTGMRTEDPRPSFCLTESVFPQIKDWKVGEKYKLEVEVEQVGSRIDDYGDNKGKMVADFKISGIMVDADADEKGESADKETKDYPKAMIKNKK